jgi:hypothetical protein
MPSCATLGGCQLLNGTLAYGHMVTGHCQRRLPMYLALEKSPGDGQGRSASRRISWAPSPGKFGRRHAGKEPREKSSVRGSGRLVENLPAAKNWNVWCWWIIDRLRIMGCAMMRNCEKG